MGGGATKVRRNEMLTGPLNQPPGVVGQFGAPNWNSGLGAQMLPMTSPMMGVPLMGTPLQAGQFSGGFATPINAGFGPQLGSGFCAPLNAGFGAPLNAGFGAPLGGFGSQLNNAPMGSFASAPMSIPMGSGAFTAPMGTTFTAPMPMTSPQMQMGYQPPQNVQYVPLQQLQHMAQTHCHTHPHSSYEISSNQGEYVIPQQISNENQTLSARRTAKSYNYTQTAVPRSA
jgi:hypothetical protein